MHIVPSEFRMQNLTLHLFLWKINKLFELKLGSPEFLLFFPYMKIT